MALFISGTSGSYDSLNVVVKPTTYFIIRSPSWGAEH